MQRSASGPLFRERTTTSTTHRRAHVVTATKLNGDASAQSVTVHRADDYVLWRADSYVDYQRVFKGRGTSMRLQPNTKSVIVCESYSTSSEPCFYCFDGNHWYYLLPEATELTANRSQLYYFWLRWNSEWLYGVVTRIHQDDTYSIAASFVRVSGWRRSQYDSIIP